MAVLPAEIQSGEKTDQGVEQRLVFEVGYTLHSLMELSFSFFRWGAVTRAIKWVERARNFPSDGREGIARVPGTWIWRHLPPQQSRGLAGDS